MYTLDGTVYARYRWDLLFLISSYLLSPAISHCMLEITNYPLPIDNNVSCMPLTFTIRSLGVTQGCQLPAMQLPRGKYSYLNHCSWFIALIEQLSFIPLSQWQKQWGIAVMGEINCSKLKYYSRSQKVSITPFVKRNCVLWEMGFNR